ncbi:MAG: hypothetical protein QY309_13115 [Cyclobacteriaceae bacterium]|nr:MAG: hypothetical protein QY309_13115 [Cyclobacteriaceae bacterium]
MRNNKKLIVYPVLIALTISTIIFSCEPETPFTDKKVIYYDALTDEKFNLNDQLQSNELVRILAKEEQKISVVDKPTILTLTDNKGDFKAISMTYQIGEFITKLTIPLSEINSNESKGATYYMRIAESCEMKCTTSWPCSSCTQEIIQRCVSQTCTCNNGSSGCSSSIIFSD